MDECDELGLAGGVVNGARRRGVRHGGQRVRSGRRRQRRIGQRR
jgi:hypothetical protein